MRGKYTSLSNYFAILEYFLESIAVRRHCYLNPCEPPVYDSTSPLKHSWYILPEIKYFVHLIISQIGINYT